MTVQAFDNFLAQQIASLREYISPGYTANPVNAIHWPLIAQVALEAKYAIASFVETELQRQSVSRAAKYTFNYSSGAPLSEYIDTINNVELASLFNSHDHSLPVSLLRPVRTSLYKLARVIKPYHLYVSSNYGATGAVGTWRQANINTFPTLPFDRLPYRDVNKWDHWFISLSFWLFSFNTGLYFGTAANAWSGNPSIFTHDLQAAALMDLDSVKLKNGVTPTSLYSYYIRNSNNGNTSWASIVNNMTVLMTLSQSLDTLLELPELRLGVLCANYLKKIGELLPDVIDYNIDLLNKSNESVAHYVQGKMRLIREFTLQELESLNGLTVGQIPCDNDQNGLRVATLPPAASTAYFTTRLCTSLAGARTAIGLLPSVS